MVFWFDSITFSSNSCMGFWILLCVFCQNYEPSGMTGYNRNGKKLNRRVLRLEMLVALSLTAPTAETPKAFMLDSSSGLIRLTFQKNTQSFVAKTVRSHRASPIYYVSSSLTTLNWKINIFKFFLIIKSTSRHVINGRSLTILCTAGRCNQSFRNKVFWHSLDGLIVRISLSPDVTKI